MTDREKIIVSAYTGVLMCDFNNLHKYIEDILGRPVFTHEMADKSIQDEIKEKARKEFLTICNTTESQWIPVSERLPEKYGQYLVTFIPSAGTPWIYVLIAHYNYRDLTGIAKPSFHIGNVGKNGSADITEQVIAWMPLPEPYAERREE